MAVSSLPSPYGIGTLGKAAYDFVDFLKAAGQSYWQMLPLNPTSYGDSPYQSFSAYAGNPYFIDPDMLVKDGLLKQSECTKCDWGGDPRHVDYGKIYESRFALLHKAYKRGWERDADKVAAFVEDNSRWLPDYALYMACKRHFGMKAWTEWEDEDIRLRKSEAVLEKYRALLADDVQFFTYLQFLFFSQWELLRDYVHQQGIRIIGDLPIYVSLDSADVWAEPQFFQLDEELVPKSVAGVPPDYFTADGQLWGNPLYDWDAMREDGFGWWIRRIDGAGKLYDVIRIDHFRGFASYWSVPYGETTAKNGHWVTGPGMDLIDRLNGWFPQLEFIAEDLGYPTPEVAQLPGIRYVITCNGAAVWDLGADPVGAVYSRYSNAKEHRTSTPVCLLHSLMPVETAREAFAVCESFHADLRIFSDGYACTDARSIALAAARAAKKDGTEACQPNDGRFTILRDAAEWMSRNAFAIEKLCVFFENPQQAAAALPRFYAVPGVEIVQGSPKNVEVTAAGVDKGEALRALADRLGVPHESTLAVGDSENDRAMLQKAGVAAVMANGMPKIQALARLVSKADCDHDGVAEILETLGI